MIELFISSLMILLSHRTKIWRRSRFLVYLWFVCVERSVTIFLFFQRSFNVWLLFSSSRKFFFIYCFTSEQFRPRDTIDIHVAFLLGTSVRISDIVVPVFIPLIKLCKCSFVKQYELVSIFYLQHSYSIFLRSNGLANKAIKLENSILVVYLSSDLIL